MARTTHDSADYRSGSHQPPMSQVEHSYSSRPSTLQSPCAANPPSSKRVDSSTITQHPHFEETRHHRFTSISSNEDGSISTVASSVGVEKSSPNSDSILQWPAPIHDPEKGRVRRSRGPDRASNPCTVSGIVYSGDDDDQADDGQQMQEDKVMRILLYFCGPVIFLSILSAIWACIAIIITLLAQPVRLCARRLSFGQQLSGLLGPTLNLHLRLIYTPLSPHASEDATYHPWKLVAIHFASPVLSFGVIMCAWVAAVYWLVSVILGDPAGMDKRDDGRETVLGLRQWWERWLLKGVKEM